MKVQAHLNKRHKEHFYHKHSDHTYEDDHMTISRARCHLCVHCSVSGRRVCGLLLTEKNGSMIHLLAVPAAQLLHCAIEGVSRSLSLFLLAVMTASLVISIVIGSQDSTSHHLHFDWLS